MDPFWIIFIILALVLIGGGIYMLTRNPAPPRSDGPPPSDSPQGADSEVDRYDVGGEHVAAGDAEVRTAPAPYDQEADASQTAYEHDGETHVEPETVDQTVSQDTATGTEIEIVEEEPVVRADEHLDPVDAPADPYAHGDQEQMTYGESQTEDYAGETTYAEPVPHEQDAAADDEFVVVDPGRSEHTEGNDDLDGRSADELIGMPSGDHHDESSDHSPVDRDDNDMWIGGEPRESTGGATVMGASDGHEEASNRGAPHGQPTVDSDDHHGAASENLGPEDGEGDVEEHEVDQGHPGPASQDGDDATYDGSLTHDEGVENPGPEEGEGDITPADDQGHPGHDSHLGEEATYGHDHAESTTSESDRVTDGRPEVEEVVIVEEVVVDDSSAVPAETGKRGEGQDSKSPGHADAADDMALDRGAGVNSNESTAAMVDRENEEPITSGSDSDSQVGGRETERSGGGATAAFTPESSEEPVAHEAEDEADDVESVSEDGPYGPGSAMPHEDGTGPSGFEIKGNAGSMLFHTAGSPAYDDCRAEVWFDSEDAAREAGFAHWDRKQR